MTCIALPERRRLIALPFALALASGILALPMLASAADDGPPGITKQTIFAPFDPKAPACKPPPGLTKVLAFAQDNEREFMQGVNRGLAMAAKDRGLEFKQALAN